MSTGSLIYFGINVSLFIICEILWYLKSKNRITLLNHFIAFFGFFAIGWLITIVAVGYLSQFVETKSLKVKEEERIKKAKIKNLQTPSQNPSLNTPNNTSSISNNSNLNNKNKNIDYATIKNTFGN